MVERKTFRVKSFPNISYNRDMQKPKTILALDDDGDILKILERILKNAGFNLILAQTPEEARKLMAEHLPNLVITDLNMEPENGQSFIRSIRKNRQYDDIPIIVLSAVNEFASVKDVMSLGINDYVIKPIQTQTILRKVKKALLHQDFLKWDKIPQSQAVVEIKIDAEIISLDEEGMEIKGPFKLAGNRKIHVESDVINGHLNVSSKMKTYVSAGVFINEIDRKNS